METSSNVTVEAFLGWTGLPFIVPTHSSWTAGVTVRTPLDRPWRFEAQLERTWEVQSNQTLECCFFFLNCALFRAKLEKASSNSYRRLQGVSGVSVKRAVVLNCSWFFFLQHLDILKGGVKRKKKKTKWSKTTTEQTERKGRRPESNQNCRSKEKKKW